MFKLYMILVFVAIFGFGMSVLKKGMDVCGELKARNMQTIAMIQGK